MVFGLIQKLSKNYVATAALVLTVTAFSVAFANDKTKIQKKTPPFVPRLNFSILCDPSDVYRNNCASCHGIGGDGRGPSTYDSVKREYIDQFKDHKIPGLGCPAIAGIDAETLKGILTNVPERRYDDVHGRVMPVFEYISDEEIKLLVRDLQCFGRRYSH